MNPHRYVIAEFVESMPVAFVRDNGIWGYAFTDKLDEAVSFPSMKSALKVVKMNEKEMGHCVVTQAKGCIR